MLSTQVFFLLTIRALPLSLLVNIQKSHLYKNPVNICTVKNRIKIGQNMKGGKEEEKKQGRT